MLTDLQPHSSPGPVGQTPSRTPECDRKSDRALMAHAHFQLDQEVHPLRTGGTSLAPTSP